jgi:hypothetical protein
LLPNGGSGFHTEAWVRAAACDYFALCKGKGKGDGKDMGKDKGKGKDDGEDVSADIGHR